MNISTPHQPPVQFAGKLSKFMKFVLPASVALGGGALMHQGNKQFEREVREAHVEKMDAQDVVDIRRGAIGMTTGVAVLGMGAYGLGLAFLNRKKED